jgi:TrpR-related protein YerC/YecD
MYESRVKSELTDHLYEAILSLETKEDCYRFFDDLCTVGEIQVMAQRWMVAKMLHEGETFSDINEKTGVSSATITRVRRALVYGADGYALAIRRMEAENGAPSPETSGKP